jgi:colanic acid/amylovoran biosynthesis protein
MHVEIRNTHWKNQGAQLMLRAIVGRLRAAANDWEIAVANRCATVETRRELDLRLLPWVQRLGAHADLLARLVPPLYPGCLARAADIEVILDASGFAYGDQWGAKKARIAAAYLQRAKRRGARAVLLPQALGPFEGAEIRRAFAQVVDLADLVYARDPTSLAAAQSVCGPRENIRLAPDFTHAVPGLPPELPLPPRTVGLIPNRKMLQMGASQRGAYISLFTRVAEALNDRGLSPLLILHSGEDRPLADAISERLSRPLPVREEGHPLRVKGLISQCHAVVSSRFHGLVNALSAGVPALGTGWSHKYEHLMADFGCPELLVGAGITDGALQESLDAILVEPARRSIIERLRAATRRQVEQTDAMWRDVLAEVRPGLAQRTGADAALSSMD